MGIKIETGTISSSEITRKQFVSLVAKLRGHLYQIKHHLEDGLPHELMSELNAALACSIFNVDSIDLENGNFASLPAKMVDAEFDAIMKTLTTKENPRLNLKKKKKKNLEEKLG